MPYAVFSKRTKTITRIVHDLSSLLPSESMIEVDDEISFPRNFRTKLLGQQVNTLGMKVFNQGSEVSPIPTDKPYKKLFDGNGRAKVSKYPPIFVQFANEDGSDREARMDIPIYANPLGWTAKELAQAKYEAILSKNYPFEVVIGEEWISTQHIDAAASSGYILSEGSLFLNPGGVLETIEFGFKTPRRKAAPTTAALASTYTFDTYYCMVEPEMPPGILAQWMGMSWEVAAPGGLATMPWQSLVTDDETATYGVGMTPLDDGVQNMTTFKLRFTNTSPETFIMENFILLLRAKQIY